MVNYTWEHFTPFTLGLDETFSRLETLAGSGTNYPPYNIYNGSDSRTILEVALAGFSLPSCHLRLCAGLYGTEPKRFRLSRSSSTPYPAEIANSASA